MIEELAINGGEPIRETLLPYGHQSIDKKDIDAVTNTLKSGYITTGPKVSAFEEKIANYVEASYAVSFNSGTAALHGAAFAAGFKKGHEVITTSMSFAATANSLLYRSTFPVFIDIEKNSQNISVKKIKKFIKKNYTFDKKQLVNKETKQILTGIIPVHFAGHPCKMDEIHELAKKYNLMIIEDGAHALGSSFYAKSKWNKVGSCAFSNMTIFSFHPVKHISTGEGGIVTTNDRKLYNILMQFKNHGITRNPDILQKNQGSWHYEMQFLGYNYRMPDINAALGISQLHKSQKFLTRRSQIAAKYIQAFSNFRSISLPTEKKWARSSWHIFVIKVNKKYLLVNRDKIFNALKAENIGVNLHYIPIHKHPFYKKNKLYIPDKLTNTEKAFEEMITLPIFPAMTDQDINDVINAVTKVLNHFSKKLI
jgi:perosamine synthetase